MNLPSVTVTSVPWNVTVTVTFTAPSTLSVAVAVGKANSVPKSTDFAVKSTVMTGFTSSFITTISNVSFAA